MEGLLEISMSKKLTIFLITSVFLSVGAILFLVISNTSSSLPFPGANPTPTPVNIIPRPTIPVEMIKEKVLQENYAKERAALLEEKPWLLQLPLKSTNYFISYDTERNEFVASIYAYSSPSITNEEQFEKARLDVVEAIRGLKVNPDKQSIIYIETIK